jgi:cytoskeletal protein RodZ
MGEFFKKFWWLLILIIILLLFVIAWLFFFYKSEEKTTPSATTTSQTNESTTSTTSEKTESDSELLRKAVSTKTGIPLETIVVSINENTGKYAKGTVSSEGEMAGGGYWLAVKEGGNWTIAFDGQSTPECSQVDPSGFPASMVPECFDSSGNIIVRS